MGSPMKGNYLNKEGSRQKDKRNRASQDRALDSRNM